MAIFNKILGDCVIIYKDAYGKNRLISGDADALFYDWWHECNYVGSNDAPVVYASCCGVEVKCSVFEEYMAMIGKIVGSCKDIDKEE